MSKQLTKEEQDKVYNAVKYVVANSKTPHDVLLSFTNANSQDVLVKNPNTGPNEPTFIKNPKFGIDGKLASSLAKVVEALKLDSTMTIPQIFYDKAVNSAKSKFVESSFLPEIKARVKLPGEVTPEVKKVESASATKQEAKDPFEDKRSLANLLKELEKYVIGTDTEREVTVTLDDTYVDILDKFTFLRGRGYETLVNNWPESEDELNKIVEPEKARYLAIKEKGNNAGNIELELALKENEAAVVDEAITKEEDTQSQMVAGVVPNSVSKTNEEEEDTLESEEQELSKEIIEVRTQLREKYKKAQVPEPPVPEPPGPVPEPPGPDSGGPSEPIPADVNTQESTNQSVTNPQTTQYAADQITAKHPPKYHLYSIFLFFGDKELPEWDYELENNIFSSGISEEDAVIFMDDIVEEFGKKIFVKKRMSKSLDELNELTQLEFCWQRNLARGGRSKNALIKVEDLINLGLGNEVQNDQPTDKPEEANGYVPQETQVQFKKSTDQEISDLVSKKEYDFNGKYLLDDDVVNQVRTKRVYNNIGPTNMQDDAKSGFSSAPLFMGMPSVDPGIKIISNAPPTKKVKTNKVKPSITF